MKNAWRIAALLTAAILTSSCGWQKAGGARVVPDYTPEDLRDNPIGPNAAEPPWRDLVRHTTIPRPAKPSHPAPSADGAFFAYTTTEFGPHPQIAVRQTYGATATHITANGSDNAFPRVSPDGKRVAYASNRAGNWDIYVARIDAPFSVTQITFDEEDEIAPAWSPDGKRLAYSSRGEGDVWQLVLAEVGSRIRTYLGTGLYPDWSPNPKEDWICFQSQPRAAGGRSSIWLVRPDGTGLREVVGDKAQGWSAINPRFSPCGGWIAYATVQKSVESRTFGTSDEADDIWLIRTDGTLDMRLTDDLSGEGWPAWGGDRVFFVSDRQSMQGIWSVRVKPLEDK